MICSLFKIHIPEKEWWLRFEVPDGNIPENNSEIILYDDFGTHKQNLDITPWTYHKEDMMTIIRCSFEGGWETRFKGRLILKLKQIDGSFRLIACKQDEIKTYVVEKN